MMRNRAEAPLTLPAADFDFGECLTYLSRNANELLHTVDPERGTVTKLIPAGDGSMLITLEQRDGALAVTFPEREPDSREKRDAAAYVTEWLDLERDLRPFYDMAVEDPILAEIAAAHRGLRLVGVPDLFEALVWSIAGQQISLHVAYLLKRRLVETYGNAVVRDGRAYWRFPEPARLAELEPDDLIPLKFSRKKAEYVVGVARLCAEGSLSKEDLAACADLAGMEKRLTAVRGIGSWSANYAIMRCIRHPDAYPAADVGLHNALKGVLGMDRKPTTAEVLALGSRWAGWKSYATFYLWRSLLP